MPITEAILPGSVSPGALIDQAVLKFEPADHPLHLRVGPELGDDAFGHAAMRIVLPRDRHVDRAQVVAEELVSRRRGPRRIRW